MKISEISRSSYFGSLALDWCDKQGITFLTRNEAGEVFPEIKSAIHNLKRPINGMFPPNWFAVKRQETLLDDMPLFPDVSGRHESEWRIIASDTNAENLAFGIMKDRGGWDAYPKTGFVNKNYRPVKHKGHPGIIGNGHFCKDCWGTGKGREFADGVLSPLMNYTIKIRMACPSCNGTGRAPGPGDSRGFNSVSWASQNNAYEAYDDLKSWALRLLSEDGRDDLD